MIDALTRLYGIIGNPARHSLSPVIHNGAFRRMGLNAVYLSFEVDDLESAVRGIRGLGVQGVSVTIPYKVKIISHLDEIDPMATKIKAINTILNRDGKLIGYNTDWIGAIAALEENIDLKEKTVYLLGAGGAGRAIGFGLKERGCKVTLLNRSVDRAAQLAGELGFDHRPLSSLANKATHGPDVVINATSAGMYPHVQSSPVPKEMLQEGMTVMDIVYYPLRTALLRDADEQGCQTIGGLEMLAHQGAAQLQIWTGNRADVQEIKADLREAMKQ